MIVVDVPKAPGGGRLRVAALGSCRVRAPLKALTNRGELAAVAVSPHKSYTARLALYLLEIIAGDATIPDLALPYLIDTPKMRRPKGLRDALSGGADILVLEVCSAHQFFYEDTPLQEQLVSAKLVKPHGRALLGWYRDVCLRGTADEACVEDALVKLREGGFAVGHMEELLRGVRRRRQSEEDIARDLQAMRARLGGDCLLVGPFTIAGEVGALMTARRTLMASLQAVAEMCRVASYDPSPLISHFGREAVLRGNGRDVYHYAKSFLPVIGEALMRNMLEAVQSQRSPGPAVPANIA